MSGETKTPANAPSSFTELQALLDAKYLVLTAPGEYQDSLTSRESTVWLSHFHTTTDRNLWKDIMLPCGGAVEYDHCPENHDDWDLENYDGRALCHTRFCGDFDWTSVYPVQYKHWKPIDYRRPPPGGVTCNEPLRAIRYVWQMDHHGPYIEVPGPFPDTAEEWRHLHNTVIPTQLGRHNNIAVPVMKLALGDDGGEYVGYRHFWGIPLRHLYAESNRFHIPVNSHYYVRSGELMEEDRARILLRSIAHAINHFHENGIVLGVIDVSISVGFGDVIYA